MSSSSRVPSILVPYITDCQETSVILLTSVLGATCNWLTIHFLVHFLQTTSEDGPTYRIVFTSFLRDLRFWEESLKRLGLDLKRTIRDGRFAYVENAGAFGGSEQAVTLPRLESTLLKPIRESSPLSKTILVIDGLDFLMAAFAVSPSSIEDMLGELRRTVFATVLALSADSPLVQSQRTPLEIGHAGLISSLAHQARWVIGTRILETGAARDVSGILRISKGGGYDGDGNQADGLDEREVLYFVGRDGTAKVFERGA